MRDRTREIFANAIQFAKGFKAKSPPLGALAENRDVGELDVASIGGQRRASLWLLVLIQLHLGDGGVRGIVFSEPSRFLDGEAGVVVQSQRRSRPLAPQL